MLKRGEKKGARRECKEVSASAVRERGARQLLRSFCFEGNRYATGNGSSNPTLESGQRDFRFDLSPRKS